jgi:hypothetical protein
MLSSRLTRGMTSPRSRLRKSNSLPSDTLSLHSPLPSGLTTRSLHWKNPSSRTHKWALASSTDLRFRSTSRIFFNHLPFTLANSPQLRLLQPPTYIDTTVVPATTLVQTRTPPQTPALAGIPAAGNAGSSSEFRLPCALLITAYISVFYYLLYSRSVACCWKFQHSLGIFG